MKANGISLHRIARPYWSSHCLPAGLNFLLNEYVTPAANWRAEYIKYVEVQKKKNGGLSRRTRSVQEQNAICNFQALRSVGEPDQGVTISYSTRSSTSLRESTHAKPCGRGTGGTPGRTPDYLFGPGVPVIERLPTLAVDIAEHPRTFMSSRRAQTRWASGN